MAASANRTLVIVGILLLLGLVRVGQMLLSRDGSGARTPSPLAALDTSRVDRLSLAREYEGGQRFTEAITFARTDTRWVITAEGEGIEQVEASRIASVLDGLRDMRVLRVAAEDGDLARFGLDDVRALRIVAKEGDATVADLRAIAIDGGRSYVSLDGDRAVLETDFRVPEQLSEDAWRSRLVVAVAVAPEDITRVQLRGAASSVELRRAKNGFELEQDGASRTVDTGAAEAFLASLASMRATGFIDPADAKGLDRPVLTVLIDARDGERLELKVGDATATGDRTAKTNRSRAVYRISSLDLRALEEPDFGPAASPAP